MKEKLELYGFPEWQITELLKKKKLTTGHGTYTIKDNKLFLNGIEKEIV